MAMVKRSEYPEHVSEYGVHWNFFMTMGVLLLITDVFQILIARRGFAAVGLLIAAIHEVSLSHTELGTWAIASERDTSSLVSLNKEGLTSLTGYVAITFLGLDVAHVIFDAEPKRSFFHRLVRRAILYWACFFLTQGLGLLTSRRLANLPYVLWSAAFNVSFLFGFAELEQTLEYTRQAGAEPCAPMLFEAINRHALLVFLLVRLGVLFILPQSNLATGAINISMQTMYSSTTLSMLVLGVYMSLMCGIVPLGIERLRCIST